MFQIACFPHLQQPPCTGRPEADCEAFLLLHGKQATAVHSREVARQAEALAQRFGCPVSLVRHAAWLHDISAVLSPDEMQAYAQSQAWDWDPAEQAHPFLLHQRISADMAQSLWAVRDPRVLSAISCHTTLKADPSLADMLVFLADKLAWDQSGAPPFFQVVHEALDRSPAHASLAYIDYVLDHGMILSPHHLLLQARSWLRDACLA